ncbi:MAG: diaminopimelate decarboxylase, partial [Chloroflexota bacterium]|nr:diaminopimelate decarboxylase [Chloroflexota bacterium]
DRATLDAAVAAYSDALASFYPGEAGLTYAAKAFLCVALAQWTQLHGLWIDCTGVGELRIALAAGVPRAHILAHGVNKSAADLRMARSHAGTVVVDNLTELRRWVSLSEREGEPRPDLWLRFRPGRAVETHPHVQTGQHDSKFGMGEDEILEAARICRRHQLPLTGLHFHLGSQFRDPEPVGEALDESLRLMQAIQPPDRWALCPGGGWGVAYHADDLPQPSIEAYVGLVAERVRAGCEELGLPLPRLHLEPGRSIVARAAVAVYRVGTIKETASRRWLLLDGGLADNPRPALYGAKYSALPVHDPRRPEGSPTWLAGPYCESGDVLIEAEPLAEVEPGELLAVPAGGAYQLSMSSNYNGARRPAVLWLHDGAARLVRESETPDDLIRRDKYLFPLNQATLDHAAPVAVAKYHVLGNTYLVVDPADLPQALTSDQIRRVCDRHHGLGADGILVGPDQDAESDFALRFYNPDGSEFEKSGNGLSIFSRYLWDKGVVRDEPFSVSTPGGLVTGRVYDGGARVTVEMGRVSFDSRRIPVTGPPREVLDESITAGGETFRYSAATIGNPHCVVLVDETSPELARRWGPLIETDERFPRGTNVQFAQILDRANVRIEIWERAVGYTLASGTSSCAAAAVARRLGLCDRRVAVHAPGGTVQTVLDDDLSVTLDVPVTAISGGFLSAQILHQATP